jgi:putative transposase
MPRRLRCSDGGYVYHVLNRAVGRATLFQKSGDYAAFEKILRQGWEEFGIGVLSCLIMPNHWHLAVWHLAVRPAKDGELSAYMQWISSEGDARCPDELSAVICSSGPLSGQRISGQ